MALARTWSVALAGLHGRVVEVEADLAQGLPALTVVGLPDTSVSEARDRVRAAVVNSGAAWPQRRITVNMSPASVPKAGAAFDLSIAVSVLAAAGEVDAAEAGRWVFLGELGLDGRVRAVAGTLPSVLAAAQAGFTRVVVARANLAEAQLVPGLTACGVETLREVGDLLCGRAALEQFTGLPTAPESASPVSTSDLCQVVGQDFPRYALEVAAAGGHHLFFEGPPGCGKTMLAERLPGLLPDLDRETALEVTAVHSVAGALPQTLPLVTRPPFRAPHHSATLQALIGGGSGALRPGAVSLAHRGVLFLDEAPEFSAHVLDALRQPLESGSVEVARARQSARFPARFQFVMAANPCPCGRATRGPDGCECTAVARRRYLGRLSGPLLDRMDIRMSVEEVPRSELLQPSSTPEPSSVVARRVADARRAQRERFRGTPWQVNAEVPGPVLRGRWPLDREVLREALSARGPQSARGFDKAVRLAWTVADLQGLDRPGPEQMDVACLLRDMS